MPVKLPYLSNLTAVRIEPGERKDPALRRSFLCGEIRRIECTHLTFIVRRLYAINRGGGVHVEPSQIIGANRLPRLLRWHLRRHVPRSPPPRRRPARHPPRSHRRPQPRRRPRHPHRRPQRHLQHQGRRPRRQPPRRIKTRINPGRAPPTPPSALPARHPPSTPAPRSPLPHLHPRPHQRLLPSSRGPTDRHPHLRAARRLRSPHP